MVFATHRAFLVGPAHRRPNVNLHLAVIREPEGFRHHSRDQEIPPFHRDVMADKVWVRTEVFPPELVTKDNHVRVSRLVFFGGENAAQQRGNSERFKKTGTHGAAIDLQRLRSAGEREAAVVVDRHPLENVVVSLPVEIIRGRHGEGGDPGKALRRRRVPDAHEPRCAGKLR